MKFKHGQRVKCTIGSTEIEDAKISIDVDGRPFICQNLQNGADAENKLGYEYSWRLSGDFTSSAVSNLRPAEKSFDYPEIGDVYVDNCGKERTVLGICGRIIHLSDDFNQNHYSNSYTKEELINYGYTIKQDKEEIEELTMEEVCKQLGRTIKIKK